jgi:hypothetical protein
MLSDAERESISRGRAEYERWLAREFYMAK